jgi:hypothetical protein
MTGAGALGAWRGAGQLVLATEGGQRALGRGRRSYSGWEVAISMQRRARVMERWTCTSAAEQAMRHVGLAGARWERRKACVLTVHG